MSFWNTVVHWTGGNKLFASTSKAYYVAGELVSGTITAELVTPLQGQGIDLEVVGYEKAEWTQKTSRTDQRIKYKKEHDRPHAGQTPSASSVTTTNKGSTSFHVSYSESHTSNPNVTSFPANYQGGTDMEQVRVPILERYRHKKNFFKTKIRIYNISGGTMQPGSYSFPFTYQLPSGLPGSFYHRVPLGRHDVEENSVFVDRSHVSDAEFADHDDDHSEANIHLGQPWSHTNKVLAAVSYKLKVTLDVGGFFTPNLHATVPLVVHTPLNSNITPAYAEKTQNITQLFFFSKGKCSLKAWFDKTAYVPGETAKITAEVTNESSKDLPLLVKLRRTIELRSRDGNTHTLHDVLITQKYEGVNADQHVTRALPLPLVGANGQKIVPSTDAECVKCSYKYTVEAYVSWGSDLVLEMPVIIYAPQPTNNPWAPSSNAQAHQPVIISTPPQIILNAGAGPQVAPYQYVVAPEHGGLPIMSAQQPSYNFSAASSSSSSSSSSSEPPPPYAAHGSEVQAAVTALQGMHVSTVQQQSPPAYSVPPVPLVEEAKRDSGAAPPGGKQAADQPDTFSVPTAVVGALVKTHKTWGPTHGDTVCFDDCAFLVSKGVSPPSLYHLSEVRVWEDRVVHGLQCLWSDARGTHTVEGPIFGKAEADNPLKVLVLNVAAGEKIIAVQGLTSVHLNQLTLSTNFGQVKKMGTKEEGTAFNFDIPDSYRLLGFFGGYGGDVHNIGGFYTFP